METRDKTAHLCKINGEKCTNAKAELLCPACTRSILYQRRLGLAQILLQIDLNQRQIKTLFRLEHNKDPFKQGSDNHNVILHHLRRQCWQNDHQLELQILRERARAIKTTRATVQHLVNDMKRSLDKRREQLRLQRVASAFALATLGRTEEKALNDMKKEVRSTQRKHHLLQGDILTARALLCKEAATLAGLHRKLDPASVETFAIGGCEIFSLRELHAVSWTHFSSVMAGVARLVVLACHYLHVRLPAQIVLPFRDYSQPSILSPSSSYEGWLSLSRHIASGLKPASGAGNVPHARPLHADRDLSALAKEDTNVYSRVLEGVSLLAWDIAWLCRVQGIETASENWSDFMEMGRNLWLLLLSDQEQRLKHSSEKPTGKTQPSNLYDVPRQSASPHKPARIFHSFGLFSHGTAFNFLDSAAFSRSTETSVSAHSWPFSHPSKISDNLKAMLQNEMSGLEWEMLEHTDSDVAGHHAIDTGYKLVNDHGHSKRLRAANIGIVKNSQRVTGEPDSLIAEETHAQAEPVPQNSSRGHGSGWTKLKSRN